jgi:general secretion pathway protein I
MARRATNVCRNAPRTAGFTLIEVVVALAVLAVAMSAVMRVISQSIDIAAEMRSRTVALWVAQDRLTNHRLTRNWPALETKDDKATMLGLEWRVREQVSTTQVPEMRRIDIEVRAAGGDHVLARVSGFLRQP